MPLALDGGEGPDTTDSYRERVCGPSYPTQNILNGRDGPRSNLPQKPECQVKELRRNPTDRKAIFS